MTTPAKKRPAPKGKTFKLERTVKAPIELVFDAWTKPEHLAHWWGPAGLNLEVVKMDFRVGGLFHYKMFTPDGKAMYGKLMYTEIEPPHTLAFVVAFSDENEGTHRHPMSATWPIQVYNLLTLHANGNETLLKMEGWPIEEQDHERQTFEDNFHNLENGFAGTLKQLDTFLDTLQKQ